MNKVSSDLMRLAKGLMAEDEDAFKGYSVLLEYVAKKHIPVLTAQDIHRDVPTIHNFAKKYHDSVEHLGYGCFRGRTEHGEFDFDAGGAMNHDGGISWTTLQADEHVLRDLGYDIRKVERALQELVEKAAPKTASVKTAEEYPLVVEERDWQHFGTKEGGGYGSLPAKLFAKNGSWWLEFSDGRNLDLQYQQSGPNGYRRRQMEEMISRKTASVKTAAIKEWDPAFFSEHDANIMGRAKGGQYVAFQDLSPEVQRQAIRAYPYKRDYGAKYDFVDEHFYYPVKADGTLARGDRFLAIPYKLIMDDAFMGALGYSVNKNWEMGHRGRRTAGAILRLDGWKEGKPEISVHNQWFVVEKEGEDLGRLTRVPELKGWVVTKIVPNRYIMVTSPDGEEHDFAYGFKLNID